MGVAEDHVAGVDLQAADDLADRAQARAAQLLTGEARAQRADPGAVERADRERVGREQQRAADRAVAATAAGERPPRSRRGPVRAGAEPPAVWATPWVQA